MCLGWFAPYLGANGFPADNTFNYRSRNAMLLITGLFARTEKPSDIQHLTKSTWLVLRNNVHGRQIDKTRATRTQQRTGETGCPNRECVCVCVCGVNIYGTQLDHDVAPRRRRSRRRRRPAANKQIWQTGHEREREHKHYMQLQVCKPPEYQFSRCVGGGQGGWGGVGQV